jgi:N-terminal region of Chorein or VPS13
MLLASGAEGIEHKICFIITGDVMLKDLKLKAEALNSLELPVTVKAGFVGTITIKVLFSHFSNIYTLLFLWL